MTLVRVLRTEQRTLTRRIYSDETLVDAAGPVTVQVARLDGTVLTSGTATDEAGTGVYSFVLTGGPAAPASVTWQLDTLVVTWTGTIGGAAVTLPPDYVEVAGGHLFGLAEARAVHKTLADTARYPTELLADTRIAVEQECEEICGRGFVPRFARVAATGTGRRTLTLPRSDVRAVRSVTVDGVAEAASATVTDSGVLTRGGVLRWPTERIVVEFEYGADYPPSEISDAAITRLRSKLTQVSSNIPDRAMSYTVVQGGVYRLSTPSARRTGIPEVDAVYDRYSMLVGGFA